jgi:dihydrofolate reductase
MSKKLIIVAVGNNGEIGVDNRLLWKQKEDMKLFKDLTSESLNSPTKAVVMGYNTWESIPEKFRPLPNRKNIVLSRKHTTVPGALVASSIEQAIQLTEDIDEVFFIGGSSVYKEALQFVDEAYITRILADFPEANVFFKEALTLPTLGFTKTPIICGDANTNNQYYWSLEHWTK